MTTQKDTRMTQRDQSDREVQVQRGRVGSEAQQPLRRRVRAAVDIFENADEILLYADLPGVEPENLDVRLDNGLLTVEGGRTSQGAGAREQAHWVYQRSFQLPGGTDSARIQASLKQGVLELHLPKKEQVKARQIKVQAL